MEEFSFKHMALHDYDSNRKNVTEIVHLMRGIFSDFMISFESMYQYNMESKEKKQKLKQLSNVR